MVLCIFHPWGVHESHWQSGLRQGSLDLTTSPPPRVPTHSGGNPGANLKSISQGCYLFEVAFVWELTKETIVLPLGCLQGGGGLVDLTWLI